VITDYRTPDRIRLAPAPLYTSFTEVFDAMERLREMTAAGTYREQSGEAAPAP
jgi:kynureninase